MLHTVAVVYMAIVFLIYGVLRFQTSHKTPLFIKCENQSLTES